MESVISIGIVIAIFVLGMEHYHIMYGSVRPGIMGYTRYLYIDECSIISILDNINARNLNDNC